MSISINSTFVARHRIMFYISCFVVPSRMHYHGQVQAVFDNESQLYRVLLPQTKQKVVLHENESSR